MDKIKLGFVPTRRSIFSAPDAIKYRGLTADRLREIGVDIVDIDDINDEGLLFDDSHIEPDEEVPAPRASTASCCATPTLVPSTFALALPASSVYPCCCGAHATSAPSPTAPACAIASAACSPARSLRRFQVPFTYMTNCRLTDPEFERGVWDFLAVCNVVKTFKHTRILQMATRPFDFWSTMCNEGELLEVQHPAFAHPHDRACPGRA